MVVKYNLFCPKKTTEKHYEHRENAENFIFIRVWQHWSVVQGMIENLFVYFSF